MLEVVKIKSPNLNPDGLVGPVTGDKFSQDDQREDAVPEETGRLDRRYGKEPYSKMVDSDEETSGSSSEEEQFTSGYEQHFMPSPLEVSFIKASHLIRDIILIFFFLCCYLLTLFKKSQYTNSKVILFYLRHAAKHWSRSVSSLKLFLCVIGCAPNSASKSSNCPADNLEYVRKQL